jgi:ADP-heptose:LPS heptosyltransferase
MRDASAARRGSRFPSRLLIAALALWKSPSRLLSARKPPPHPRRILVLHTLLLGDTIMLSALVARLRAKYPEADIVMTCSAAQQALYSGHPWGVRTVVYDERDIGTLRALLATGPYDLVLIPAETRLSWLAVALGAKWIVAFAGDRPAYKNWPVDSLLPFSTVPIAWGDMAAQLADPAPPRAFRRGDWPAPASCPFDAPPAPYCVLHVGAGTPLRLWPAARWRQVLDALLARGFAVAITCGAEEAALALEIDPEQRARHYAGALDLAQLWHLLHGARLTVSLDTGIAHLARAAGSPLVVLFGPGSAQLFGGGNFFSAAPERKVFIPDFFCRDENMIFRRKVIWAAHCGRNFGDCTDPKCMHAIDVAMVLGAIGETLEKSADAR